MIQVHIPGRGPLTLAHLVLDFNGTLAVDGRLIQGVSSRLTMLSQSLTVHVITADTFGSVESQMAGIPCRVAVLPPGDQDLGKQQYVQNLGASETVAMGNGRNDRRMLFSAALGVALLQTEGVAAATLGDADIVCTDICSALDLLSHPKRLVATLRT